MKTLGPEVLLPIFKKAEARFEKGMIDHADKPFFGQFSLWGDMKEELLDVINYAAMQIIRIEKLEALEDEKIREQGQA